MNRKEYIISYINKKLTEFQELGHIYSEEKINALAEKLAQGNKTLEDICLRIDNRFKDQIKKIEHNDSLKKIKEHYKESVEKLKKGNNCYLLSYTDGVKILEQALVEQEGNRVKINNNKKGIMYSLNNAYEMIQSELAYLLNIPYPYTYCMYDENMEPQGIIKVEEENRFLTLEETLQFVKEESSSFTAKQTLIEYHDKKQKRKLAKIPSKKEYKVNIEYVLNLFKLLPDITMKNYEELKKAYLNRKVFELLTNSLENTLDSIGIVIHKGKKYTYSFIPSPQEIKTKKESLTEEETICNFYIVEKKELFHTLVVNYYEDIKEICSLLIDNKDSLSLLLEQISKSELEYEEYQRYKKQIKNNIEFILLEIQNKKIVSPDTEEDISLYKINNENYKIRIEPFFEDKKNQEDEKGSATIVTIIGIVLFITILLILATIYAISKVEM